MSEHKKIPGVVYKLALVLATVIWGLAFVVMKDAVSVMEPAWLIGVRFTLTAVLLTLVFFRNVRATLNRDHLVRGAVLGVLLFIAFWTQTIGLDHTTPGKNAFLTATYCVLVPFFGWMLMSKKPSAFNVAAALLCIVGIGLVSLASGAADGGAASSAASFLGMSFGDFMTLVCAVFFAVHIVYVSKYSEGRDVLALTVYQFWVGGVCGLVVGGLTEPAPNLAAITPEFLFNLAYLVVFASCVALVIQNVALAHVPPAQGSLFLSLESVFGVAFSVLLYGEQLSLRLVAGFVLIFAAVVVSEVLPERFRRKEDEPAGARPREAEVAAAAETAVAAEAAVAAVAAETAEPGSSVQGAVQDEDTPECGLA